MSLKDGTAEFGRFVDTETGLTLDLIGMGLDPDAVAALTEGPDAPIAAAHREMQALEKGAIKNPDENRRVTHFTDRLHYVDSDVYRHIAQFSERVRTSRDDASDLSHIDQVVINGIGGSALGPQLVQHAINGPYWNELSVSARRGYPRLYFVDNTDSAGIADLRPVLNLEETVVVTISKSGGTRETLNNMLAFEQLYQTAGLRFGDHAVAVTMPGSRLDRTAEAEGWLARFPMADSIGGRTSVTNVVGHVPAALAGVDFAALLDGARHMDRVTRRGDVAENPAYQLAVAWYAAGSGRGDRNMVIVPYADRLLLLGRYLQQLVMESLGKEKDLDGTVVHQGLTVYGNKGGTDAHAYIQQLNDGRDDFFLTFVEVLRDSEEIPLPDGLSMGDYLHAFKTGLLQALTMKGRKVLQIVVENLDEFSLGMLIGLYERAVAVYAELIHINAFHQPGVENYKKLSGKVNDVNHKLRTWIKTLTADWAGTAAEAAADAGCPESVVEVEGILAKFAVNATDIGGRSVTRTLTDGAWHFAVAS